MVFTQLDVIALLAIGVFTYWQPRSATNYTPWWYVVAKFGSKTGVYTYNPNTNTANGGGIVHWLPRPMVYGIMWTIVYGLLTVSNFLFWRNFFNVTLWSTWYITYIATIMLLKLWPLLFYEYGGITGAWMGLVNIIISLLGLSAILVFYIIEEAYISMALHIFPILWVGYALVLNAQFVNWRHYIYSTTGPSNGLDQYKVMTANGLVGEKLSNIQNDYYGQKQI